MMEENANAAAAIVKKCIMRCDLVVKGSRREAQGSMFCRGERGERKEQKKGAGNSAFQEQQSGLFPSRVS